MNPKFYSLVALSLALLVCYTEARSLPSGRGGGRDRGRPIVNLRNDHPKKNEDVVVGQIHVDTAGLEDVEHEKLVKGQERDKIISGSYIALMKPEAEFDELADMLETVYATSSGNDSIQIFGATTFVDSRVGFRGQMNKAALMMMLENKNIATIEEDQRCEGADFVLTQKAVSDIEEVVGQVTTYDVKPQWHTSRINQRFPPIDDNHGHKYRGNGVDIYILDSGIRYSHQVFDGHRARFGGYDHYGNGRGDDDHGHGTHCAGLASGSITGPADRSNVYSIKVLNSNLGGSFSAIIAGINHVVQQAARSGRRTIISMSLIGPKSPTVDQVIKTAKERGVISVVAAGNFRRDACDYSPASSEDAITVGGTQEDGDKLYWFSSSSRSPGTDYGKCVDIFAPGQWIRSAGHFCDDCLVSMSGTSMATPIAAGVVALLLEQYPNDSPDRIKNKLIDQSTKNALDFGVIGNDPNTPNRLVFVEPASGPRQGDTPPTPPPDSTQSPPDSTRSPTTTPRVTQPPTEPPPPFCPGESTKLPSKPGFAQPAIRQDLLRQTIDEQKAAKYIPREITPYKIGDDQYFSVVYFYAGSKVNYYEIDYDSTASDVRSLEAYYSSNGRRYKLQYLVPYNKGVEIRFITVFNWTNDDIINYINFSPNDFYNNYAAAGGAQSNGYQLLSRKIVVNSDGNLRISAIAGRRPSRHFYYDNLGLEQLISKIQAHFKDSYFLMDLHSYMYNGDTRYIAIFSPECYEDKEHVIRYNMDRYTAEIHVRTLAANGYHVRSLLPLPESFYPFYLGIWWK